MFGDWRNGFNRPDGTRFPPGCSARDGGPLVCRANLSGQECRLCWRDGAPPPAGEWHGPAYQIVGQVNVQFIETRKGGWVVVTFRSRLQLHPQMPPIACGNEDQAFEYAVARARQFEPRAILKHQGDGDWRLGNLLIWRFGGD